MNYTDTIKSLCRAKCLVIWTRTREEQRAERALITAAASLQMKPYSWTVTGGLFDHSKQISDTSKQEPMSIWTTEARNIAERQMIIIKDGAEFLQQAPGIRRYIRDEMSTGRTRPAEAQKMYIFLDLEAAPANIPGIMEIDLGLPTRQELESLLSMALQASPEEIQTATDTATQAAIIDAMTGLDSNTARNALLKSRVDTGGFSPEYIAQEKRQFIKSPALTWTDPDPRGMDAIGGLEVIKADLMQMKAAFTPEAREWGLPAPKGALIVGIPGTGKSLTAKCCAAVWRLPLIKFDVSAIYGKYVGDSEKQMRDALEILDAASPAVIWLDEVEKAFSGMSGDGDGGAAARVFGQFLTWTQERAGRLFLIATANDISKLPPEFKRAGRFDRLYFVDVPHFIEREAIAQVMKRKFTRASQVDATAVATASENYTGAEIEAAFEGALYRAYNDGKRDPKTADVIAALADITPVIKSDAEKLNAARQWAKSCARPASLPDTRATTTEKDDFAID